MSSQKVSQNMGQMLLETTKLKPRRGINWKISDVQVYKRPVIICKFFFFIIQVSVKGGKIAAKKDGTHCKIAKHENAIGRCPANSQSKYAAKIVRN